MRIKQIFNKYFLMNDIRTVNIFVHLFFMLCTILMPITVTCLITYSSVAEFNYNFDELTPINGIVKVRSKSYYYERSKKTDNVINIQLITKSQTINYYSGDIESNQQLFRYQNEINNQKATVWYLPKNNNFYLIKFQNTNLNSLEIAKYSQKQLNSKVLYIKYVLPLISLLMTISYTCLQIYLIREFMKIMPDYYCHRSSFLSVKGIKDLVSFPMFIITGGLTLGFLFLVSLLKQLIA